MSHLPSSQYLKTQILTASQETLQLMLWDGAIRFAEQGREALVNKDFENSHRLLVRAQKIILEMNSSLRHDVNPDLCQKMAALYNFIYRRLVEGNMNKDAKSVQESLEIMRHQRETWVLLMDKLSRDRAAEIQATVDTIEENAAALATPASREMLQEISQVTGAMPPARPVQRSLYSNVAMKNVPVSRSLSVDG